MFSKKFVEAFIEIECELFKVDMLLFVESKYIFELSIAEILNDAKEKSESAFVTL